MSSGAVVSFNQSNFWNSDCRTLSRFQKRCEMSSVQGSHENVTMSRSLRLFLAVQAFRRFHVEPTEFPARTGIEPSKRDLDPSPHRPRNQAPHAFTSTLANPHGNLIQVSFGTIGCQRTRFFSCNHFTFAPKRDLNVRI